MKSFFKVGVVFRILLCYNRTNYKNMDLKYKDFRFLGKFTTYLA